MNEFEKSNSARFLQLVSSASGGMGLTATIVYKRLASLLADKKKRYSDHSLAQMPSEILPTSFSNNVYILGSRSTALN